MGRAKQPKLTTRRTCIVEIEEYDDGTAAFDIHELPIEEGKGRLTEPLDQHLIGGISGGSDTLVEATAMAVFAIREILKGKHDLPRFGDQNLAVQLSEGAWRVELDR